MRKVPKVSLEELRILLSPGKQENTFKWWWGVERMGKDSLDRKVPSECGRLPVSIKVEWECDKESGVSVARRSRYGEKDPLKLCLGLFQDYTGPRTGSKQVKWWPLGQLPSLRSLTRSDQEQVFWELALAHLRKWSDPIQTVIPKITLLQLYRNLNHSYRIIGIDTQVRTGPEDSTLDRWEGCCFGNFFGTVTDLKNCQLFYFLFFYQYDIYSFNIKWVS